MNVKISEQSITFKLTEEEMRSLLAATPQDMTFDSGQGCLRAALVPFGDEEEDRSDGLHPLPPLSLRIEPGPQGTNLVMHISRQAVESLADMGKSKDGISARQGGISLKVQVDMRHDTRPRKKE
jgi:hypothetical protein